MHAALFAPLLLVGLPLVRGRETGLAPRWVLLAVLAAGLISRAFLVGVQPAPQADLHRMIWEGRVPAAGGDPYRHAPDAPELADLAATLPEVRAGVNYWKLPAIYPPAAQLFFRATTWVSVHPAAMKGALVAAEGVLVLALVLLLRCRGLHPGLVVLYVWNPLPLTAIAGEGHGDALGLAFLALGLLAAESLRPAAAACLAALSALSKVVGGGAPPVPPVPGAAGGAAAPPRAARRPRDHGGGRAALAHAGAAGSGAPGASRRVDREPRALRPPLAVQRVRVPGARGRLRRGRPGGGARAGGRAAAGPPLPAGGTGARSPAARRDRLPALPGRAPVVLPLDAPVHGPPPGAADAARRDAGPLRHPGARDLAVVGAFPSESRGCSPGPSAWRSTCRRC